MKILAIFMTIALFVGIAGFACAQNNSENSNDLGGIGVQLSSEIHAKQTEFKNSNFTGPLGQFLNVRELSANLRELRTDNTSVRTNLTFSLETDSDNRTHLRVNFSNGRDMEVKIMPDTASETALARLRIKVCNESNNCTIVLKETGSNNETSTEYDLTADQNVKVLGLFNANMHVETNVDAQTGEVISSKEPWWAALSVKS